MTRAQALRAAARVALRDAYADGHWSGRAWGVAACCGVSVHEAEEMLARHCQPAPSGRERMRLRRVARDMQDEAGRIEERAVSDWLRAVVGEGGDGQAT